MPWEEDKLDEDLLVDIIGDDQSSTEEIRKKYLEESDRDSLSHKVAKRNLESLEDEGQVESSRPSSAKLILWRVVE